MSRSLWVSLFYVSPSGYHRSTHPAAEEGHLVGSVSEDARLSECGHCRARPENHRICRSGPECPVQGGCHARYTGEVQGKYGQAATSNQIIEQLSTHKLIATSMFPSPSVRVKSVTIIVRFLYLSYQIVLFADLATTLNTKPWIAQDACCLLFVLIIHIHVAERQY